MSESPPKACRARWSRRIDRAFLGRASPRALRALRDHASTCERCRSAYDRLGDVERALEKAWFPAAARERVAALVVAPPSRRRAWAAPAGALVAAAAAILLWVVAAPPAPRDEFQARGVDLTFDQLAPGERAPGVRLFCMQVSDHGVHVTAEVHMADGAMPVPTLRCTIGDELQIAYSTPSLPGLTMIVFAESPSGATRWYAPTQAGASAVSLATDIIDEPLAWSTRFVAEHEPGHHEVVAQFFMGPLPAAPGAEPPLAELRATLVLETHEEDLP
jgi:hypothetical protein